MTSPNNLVNSDEVVVTLLPVFLDPTPPKPIKDVPDQIPAGQIHGGALFNKEGGSVFSILGHGGGAGGINAGSGLALQQAGFGFGSGAVNALIAGLLLCLLLLLSACIWACYKCKPGCCAAFAGKFGSGSAAGAGSAWKKAAAVCCAAPEKDILIAEHAGAYERDYADSMRGKNYGHNKMLDLSPGMDTGMSGMHMEQMYTDGMAPNVYNSEMKVDCCVISSNSKYAVTGSANGAPQIWDMQSGDLYRLMDGDQIGARDLHLGVDDNVLVGQVVDEVSAMGGDPYQQKLHRLQLWQFATGQQMVMPEEIMTTVTCMSRRDQKNVIIARSSAEGNSILVWDLIGNQRNREIFYQLPDGIPYDYVSFLDISYDDRLVVAGYQNPDDGQAYYMVFDLAKTYGQIAVPGLIQFDGKVEATAILSEDEAISGTRQGELFVWNLHTCQVTRQIQINATLEGGNSVMMSPHNDMIHCIALSQDGQYIVTGSKDQTARVWHRHEERLLHTLEGHADEVLSVCISPDSEMIVSGSYDGSIRVWRLRDGNQLCWFTSNIEILQVKLSNDKRAIVALGERSGQRKLIMLQIVRNKTRTTTLLNSTGSRNHLASPTSPMLGSPHSPSMMA